MNRIPVSSCLLTLLIATSALGEDPPKDPPKEASKALPEIKLESATDGGGSELTISWGPTFRLGQSDWDYTLSGNYSSKTKDNIATLFQVTGGHIGLTHDWSLGPSVTFAQLAHPKATAEDAAEERQIKAVAYGACAVQCQRNGEVDKDDAFCHDNWFVQVARALPPSRFCAKQQEEAAVVDKRPEALHACIDSCSSPTEPGLVAWCKARAFKSPDNAGEHITASELCDAGRYQHAQMSKALLARRASSFPRTLINLGIKVGQSRFEYLQPSAKVPGQTEDTTNQFGAFNAGISLVQLFGDGSDTKTLEALLGYSESWVESTDKTHSCKPTSPVVDADNPAGTTAQICNDTASARPSFSRKLSAAVYFGSVDQANPFYRIAFGARVDGYPDSSSDDKARLVFSIPITLALFEKKELGYQGILTVGPSLGVSFHRQGPALAHPNGGADLDFGIAISLSGQKYLFSQQFDRLY